MRHIARLRKSGLTIVLIEHKLNVVMSMSDRVVVLDYGQKIAEGTPEQVRDDERVIVAYLGRRQSAALAASRAAEAGSDAAPSTPPTPAAGKMEH